MKNFKNNLYIKVIIVIIVIFAFIPFFSFANLDNTWNASSSWDQAIEINLGQDDEKIQIAVNNYLLFKETKEDLQILDKNWISLDHLNELREFTKKEKAEERNEKLQLRKEEIELEKNKKKIEEKAKNGWISNSSVINVMDEYTDEELLQEIDYNDKLLEENNFENNNLDENSELNLEKIKIIDYDEKIDNLMKIIYSQIILFLLLIFVMNYILFKKIKYNNQIIRSNYKKIKFNNNFIKSILDKIQNK